MLFLTSLDGGGGGGIIMLIIIFLTSVSDSVELQIELKSTLEADKRAREDFFRSTSVRDT